MIDQVTQTKFIRLKLIHDGPDGSLLIGENYKEIPFEIKRIYSIMRLGNPLAVRGKHAHKTLETVITCLNGSFELLLDDGTRNTSVFMDDPSRSVYMGPRLWHVMRGFSKHCIILFFASDRHKASDYIRDYGKFQNHIKKHTALQRA